MSGTRDPLLTAIAAGRREAGLSTTMLAEPVAGGLVVQAVVSGDPARVGERLRREGDQARSADGARWRWVACGDGEVLLCESDADRDVVVALAAAAADAVTAACAVRLAALREAVGLWHAVPAGAGLRDLPDSSVSARLVATALAESFDAAAAVVAIADDAGGVRTIGASPPDARPPSMGGAAGRAWRTGRVQVAGELGDFAQETVICAPFDSPDGPAVVEVHTRLRRGVFAHEVALVRAAAQIVADCWWGVRLGSGDRLGQATAGWLRALAADDVVDESTLVARAAVALCPAYGADAVWLSSRAPEGRSLRLGWGLPVEPNFVQSFGVEGRTVAEGMEFGDVRVVARTSPLRTGEELPLDAAGLRSYAVVGLGGGAVFGLAARDPDHFGGLATSTLVDIGAQVAMVVGRMRAQVRAEVEAERAARASALNRRLLTSIGHQFRTPLTSIAGFARTLADPEASTAVEDADRHEFLEIIVRQATRLGRLVENFLVYADLEAGTWQPIREPVDVDAVVMGVVRDLRASGELDVDVDVTLEAGTVVADAASLRSIVLNLVDNAVRFGRVGVGFVARVDRDQLVLTAIDQGPGIPDAKRHALMALFQESSGDVNPTMGMGFAVIGEFCERLGATMALTHTPGGGLTAEVAVPLTVPAG